MTTLPPDGPDGQPTGNQPESGSPTERTGEPTSPASQPPASPQQPQEAPQQPAPQQPAPQPQASPPPPPQYQQPAGGYQQPPAGGYQQPAGGYQQPGGYAQPVADPVSNITLNYWLSAFFVWIPALIFFLIEKDKGNEAARIYHRDNLNFSLLRTGIGVAQFLFVFIPYVGGIIAFILWIAQLVAFVFHIIAAVKAPQGYRENQPPGFIVNIPLVK